MLITIILALDGEEYDSRYDSKRLKQQHDKSGGNRGVSQYWLMTK